MIDAPFILASPYPALERARTLGSHIVMAGLAADRPPAGKAGRLYFATDTNGGTLYRDSGTSWDQIAYQLTLSAPIVLRAYASADQTVTNSTTLTNDAALSLTLAASQTYLVQGFLLYTGQAADGVKADLGGGSATATSLAVGGVIDDKGTLGELGSSGSPLSSLTTLFLNTTTANIAVIVHLLATIETGAGGTLIPRHAQVAAGVGHSATRKRGSWLMAIQL
jgi:hypothetical protein